VNEFCEPKSKSTSEQRSRYTSTPLRPEVSDLRCAQYDEVFSRSVALQRNARIARSAVDFMRVQAELCKTAAPLPPLVFSPTSGGEIGEVRLEILR